MKIRKAILDEIFEKYKDAWEELAGYDEEAKISVLRGLSQKGTINLGSFAKYVKDEE